MNKGYIEAGEYISFVTDPTIIGRYRERYGFLQRAFAERDVITTLEGYLYPDTYFVDADKDIIDQLVFLQLEGFYTKVREVHGDALLALTQSLQKK